MIARATLTKTPRLTRFEIKYFVSPEVRIRLAGILRARMDTDSHGLEGHGGYGVSSLYYDTPAFANYFDKKDGVLHRLKFRLRSYGEDGESMFLESKERAADRTLKNRIAIDGAEWQALAGGRHVGRLKDEGVFQSFWRARASAGLEAKISIAYRRTAFVGHDGRRLRVTLDDRVVAARHLLVGRAGRLLRPLLPAGYSILELKFDRRMPSWLHDLVKRFELRQGSISKYCMAVEKVYGRGFSAHA